MNIQKTEITQNVFSDQNGTKLMLKPTINIPNKLKETRHFLKSIEKYFELNNDNTQIKHGGIWLE